MPIAEGDTKFERLLADWKADLEDLRSKLANVEGLTGLKDRLSGKWVAIPKTFREGLKGPHHEDRGEARSERDASTRKRC